MHSVTYLSCSSCTKPRQWYIPKKHESWKWCRACRVAGDSTWTRPECQSTPDRSAGEGAIWPRSRADQIPASSLLISIQQAEATVQAAFQICLRYPACEQPPQPAVSISSALCWRWVIRVHFRFHLTRQQVLYGLEKVQLRSTSIFDQCPLKSRQLRQEVISIHASKLMHDLKYFVAGVFRVCLCL